MNKWQGQLKKHYVFGVPFGIMTLTLSACANHALVDPLSERPQVLCIERNADVLMAAYLPMLERQFAKHDITTLTYDTTPPAQCQYTARYIASWRWDMAMYLYQAKMDVFDDSHTRVGGFDYKNVHVLKKFGTTEGKVAPMIKELASELQVTKASKNRN